MTEGAIPRYIKQDILPDFFKSLWVRRMALDRRNYREVVDTTVELAQKSGIRMAPILRNRHQMVQESTINLIGRLGSSPLMLHLLLELKYLFQLTVVPSSC